jgi:mono/diheme cytochrome c family protein
MKWRIVLGSFAFVFVMGALAYVAIGEQGRMSAFTEAYHARQIETGAALFEARCRTCHGPQGTGIEGVAPAINAPDLFNGQRLQAVGFNGTVDDYLKGVISAGRPVPSAGTNYPQRMPTWGERYGGPLRDDQIDSLVAFILNWEGEATPAGPTPGVPAGEAVGTDIHVALPPGNAEAGQSLAENLGCTGCHVLSSVGPAWMAQGAEPGIGTRASTRFQQDDYAGQAATPEEYLVESILLPQAYRVPGFEAVEMPTTYGQRLTAQQLSDLVTYLLTLH